MLGVKPVRRLGGWSRMSERAMSLRECVHAVLRMGGVELLEQPPRFLGMVMDLADTESVEMRVLERGCDAELLGPYAEAAREGTTAALDTAMARVSRLLTEDRLIQPEVAQSVAREIAWGLAFFLGVAPSDRMVEGAGRDKGTTNPAPGQAASVRQVASAPQSKPNTTRPAPVQRPPISQAPATARPATSGAPGAGRAATCQPSSSQGSASARSAAGWVSAPAVGSSTSAAASRARPAAPSPMALVTPQASPKVILQQAEILGYRMGWHRFLTTLGCVLMALVDVGLWAYLIDIPIPTIPEGDQSWMIWHTLLLVNSLTWLIANYATYSFKEGAMRSLCAALWIDVAIRIMFFYNSQLQLYGEAIWSMETFIPLDYFGNPGHKLILGGYGWVLLGIICVHIVIALGTIAYYQKRKQFFVR